MVFACDNCRFLFRCADEPEQCPDCGKRQVRPATEAEQAQFQRQLEEAKRHPL